EGTSGRLDRATHVLGIGIGCHTQHFFGGRIYRGKSALAAARQLAVDEQGAHAVGQQCHLRLHRWSGWTHVRNNPVEHSLRGVENARVSLPWPPISVLIGALICRYPE